MSIAVWEVMKGLNMGREDLTLTPSRHSRPMRMGAKSVTSRPAPVSLTNFGIVWMGVASEQKESDVELVHLRYQFLQASQHEPKLTCACHPKISPPEQAHIV